jgi:3',5'-cyclic AMP phosphodiesterase CpdA
MRKPLLLLATAVLVGVAAFSAQRGEDGKPAPPAFIIERQDRNPFTRLDLALEDGDFQFAIVSDRTGGHRAKVFSRAIAKLDLLQPEFVVTVGDLIEGTNLKPLLEARWKEIDGYVGKLSMPFFYVAGNHDAGNPDSDRFWQDKLGRRYYHFVYRNVLFLMLNSEDPPGSAGIAKEQQAWLAKTLEANSKVRWTVVFVHRPLWTVPGSNWDQVEKALGSRPYTVFCGHIHRFQKYVRGGRNYYQLATTGGGSMLRGVEQGEFDHITWVTMKKTGPLLAHVLVDSILPENLKPIETEETALLAVRAPVHAVLGKVFFEGTPAAGAHVTLVPKEGGQRAEGLVEADGSFVLTTYAANDGAVAGDYTAVVAWHEPGRDGKAGASLAPARYTKVETSPLAVRIEPGENRLMFGLKR